MQHGRASTLATMGCATLGLAGKLHGYLSPPVSLEFADVPSGPGTISKALVAGCAQIVIRGAFCELTQDQSVGTSAAACAYCWSALSSSDAAEKPSKLAAKIANVCLAMIAISGVLFQGGGTDSTWGDSGLYAGSPLHAFGIELNVQDPAGVFDPAVFAADARAEWCDGTSDDQHSLDEPRIVEAQPCAPYHRT